MVWVIVLCALAVASVVMIVCYAVWLAHKTSDVMSEVAVLTNRGGQLVELLAQIGRAERGSSRFEVPSGADELDPPATAVSSLSADAQVPQTHPPRPQPS